MKIVSISGASLLFIKANCDSCSKSEMALIPLIIIFALFFLTKSVNKPENGSTITFFKFLVALFIIPVLSWAENKVDFLESTATATINLSTIFMVLSIIFRCPLVIGSKLPG
ncbi:hypothetical protein ES705_38656 [subsurface metagenome]